MSRTSGISFVDGFEEVEDAALTDGVVAALEALIVVGAGVLAVAPVRQRWLTSRLANLNIALVGAAVALVAIPAVSEAGSFHDHGQGAELAAHAGADDGHAHDDTPADPGAAHAAGGRPRHR